MKSSSRRTVVVSAVNIRKGGTLTILRDCLSHLSGLTGEYRVIALVHDRRLCDYPGIEYMEFPDTIRSWGRRLWCEYVTMHRVSLNIAAQDGRKVWMWLSLHDTTPRVEAEHQEVYCQTSFPFMKPKLRDFIMDPKIPLFTMFTRFAYRINIHANDALIVQQEWFRDGMSRMLGFPKEKIRVIAPKMPSMDIEPAHIAYDVPMFFYASTADCHKDFETICEAARLMENELGKGRFKLVLTISGKENRYAKWLHRRWGDVSSIDFHGFMSKPELFGHYKAATAFVFPSRVETWGLPISEYMATAGGRLILADLPYAHETSAGAQDVRYFPCGDAKALAAIMKETIQTKA